MKRGYWESHPSYKDAGDASARAFADPKAARVAEVLGLRGDEPVLDVGAGTGHLTEAFRRRGHPVTALDAAAAMLRRNASPRRVRCETGPPAFPERAPAPTRRAGGRTASAPPSAKKP